MEWQSLQIYLYLSGSYFFPKAMSTKWTQEDRVYPPECRWVGVSNITFAYSIIKGYVSSWILRSYFHTQGSQIYFIVVRISGNFEHLQFLDNLESCVYLGSSISRKYVDFAFWGRSQGIWAATQFPTELVNIWKACSSFAPSDFIPKCLSFSNL